MRKKKGKKIIAIYETWCFNCHTGGQHWHRLRDIPICSCGSRFVIKKHFRFARPDDLRVLRVMNARIT